MNLNQFNNPYPTRFNFNRMNILNRRGLSPFFSPYRDQVVGHNLNPYFSSLEHGIDTAGGLFDQSQQDWLRNKKQKEEELMRKRSRRNPDPFNPRSWTPSGVGSPWEFANRDPYSDRDPYSGYSLGIADSVYDNM